MFTITITIGRNVRHDSALPTNQWKEFQRRIATLLDETIRNSGQDVDAIDIHLGEAWYTDSEGRESLEDSAMITARFAHSLDANSLASIRQAAVTIAAGYGQEAVAMIQGYSDLVFAE